MPVMPEQARRDYIAAALSASERDPQRETLRLPWREGDRVLPVVEIPLAATVLNPRSHRIRAQLESHERRGVVLDDPFTDDAQDVVREVLRGGPPGSESNEYKAIRDNVRAEGQRDPGVITRDGLLVNANRRATALMDLGREYVRVAVLPEDAGPREIDQVELRLQVQEDYKEPYTFTNRLVFVEDFTTLYDYNDDRIAEELRVSVADVARMRRTLAFIRQAQQRAGEGVVPLTFFDDKEQSLRELDDASQRLRDDGEAVGRLGDARLLCMIADQGYARLRNVNQDFIADYLEEHLEEDEVLPAAVAAMTAPVDSGPALPGLDELDVFDPGGSSASDLLDFALAAKHAGRVEVPPLEDDAPPQVIDWEDVHGHLRAVVDRATYDATLDRQAANRLLAPANYLRQARENVARAGRALDRVETDRGLDLGKLADECAQVDGAAQVLSRRIARLRAR